MIDSNFHLASKNSPPKRDLCLDPVLIIGSNGRLGGALFNRLGCSRRVVGTTREDFSLEAPDRLSEFLMNQERCVVFITAAMTGVDYCERNELEAMQVNAEGPRRIAEICNEHGSKLVYVSTDFVFDGTQEFRYSEEDQVNPISVYGASKAKGEEYVLKESPQNLAVRVSWLYGAQKPAFPEWIIQQAMEQESLSLPGEKTGSPTSCEDLAKHLEALLACNDGKGASGIVHLCNSGSCTWQEWGQFCVDEAVRAGLPVKTRKISANRLEDIKAFVAKRPVNSVLDTSKFTELTGVKPRDWREALRDHLSHSPLLREGGAARDAG